MGYSPWGHKESNTTKRLSLHCNSPVGLPSGANGKEPAYQCRRHKRLGFDPWVGKKILHATKELSLAPQLLNLCSRVQEP